MGVVSVYCLFLHLCVRATKMDAFVVCFQVLLSGTYILKAWMIQCTKHLQVFFWLLLFVNSF